MSSLLPPNSTELERKVATANAKGTDLDVKHKTLSTIDDAPSGGKKTQPTHLAHSRSRLIQMARTLTNKHTTRLSIYFSMQNH